MAICQRFSLRSSPQHVFCHSHIACPALAHSVQKLVTTLIIRIVRHTHEKKKAGCPPQKTRVAAGAEPSVSEKDDAPPGAWSTRDDV